MRKIILYVILLFTIVGCVKHPLSKVQQAVEAQAKLLVDSGYIRNQYVVLYEVAFNGSYHTYYIADSEFPVDAARLEIPSKIVSYKDKYLCFIERDEPEMSVDKMIEITSYSGNPMVDTDFTCKWFLVVSEQGEKKLLINIEDEEAGENPYLSRKELWSYFSGYVKEWPVQMGVISHDVESHLPPYSPFNVDSIRHELFDNITGVYGRMYMKNTTDSTVCLSCATDKHYAVVHQGDSLYLSLCDSLPIILKPHQSEEIRYRSISSQDHFFKSLASKEDPWESLSHLFSESTYCLIKINQKDLKTRVMNFNVPFEFKVTAGKDEYFRILPPGIYDKDAREKRNVQFWFKKQKERSGAWEKEDG